MWPSEKQMISKPRYASTALKLCLERLLKLKATRGINEVDALYLQKTRDMVRLGRMALEPKNDDEEVEL